MTEWCQVPHDKALNTMVSLPRIGPISIVLCRVVQVNGVTKRIPILRSELKRADV